MKYTILFLFSIFYASCCLSQSIELIKDIWQEENDLAITSGSLMSGLTTINDRLYFRASDGVDGKKLWVSDGTESGTVAVMATGGFLGSDDLHMVYFNGSIFFVQNGALMRLNESTHEVELIHEAGVKELIGVYLNKLFLEIEEIGSGTEIWVSDGTPDGTMLLKDINPNADNSQLLGNRVVLIEHNGVVYFARDDMGTPHNEELWKTDGTSAGTVKVKELNTESESFASSFPKHFFIHEGQLYFIAYSSDTENQQLFRTDGTEEGTVAIAPYEGTLTGFEPVYYDGYWYFSGWRTDCTVQGSTALGEAGNNHRVLGVYNDRLIVGDSDQQMLRLYSSDGTLQNTQLLMESDSQVGFYGPMRFERCHEIDGRLYVLVSKYETNYRHYGHIWVTDGTPEGTEQLTPSLDIYVYPFGSENPMLTAATVWERNFTVMDDAIYFAGLLEEEVGYELYKLNSLPAPIVSVSDESLKPNDLKVFPNPASEIIQLQNQGQQIADIQLLDSRGRSVPLPCEVNSQGQITFHVHSLPTGVYMIRLMTHLGEVHHTRWIKH
jgi:ELWxxDGT repeat protein